MTVLSSTRRFSRWSRDGRRVAQILKLASNFETVPDREITSRAQSLRWQVRSGSSLSRVLIEAFALAVTAIYRETGLRLYPVQIYGGLLLQRGTIAEMRTGEGKTLTAVAPACLRALAGRGVHVMTSNEYLAERDAGKLRPIYARLGLTVGCITGQAAPEDRARAYVCDVTYGTASEFGFDYLRDRLALAGQNRFDDGTGKMVPGMVQRGHDFALIDEADSVLLDEGRTPLIIALPCPEEPGVLELLKWAHALAGQLAAGVDFQFHPQTRQAHLTERGCRRVLLSPRPETIRRFDLESLYSRVETALQASWAYHRDREYLVQDNHDVQEVQIVDESTGRAMEGRRWEKGLHQAIEVKEGLTPSEVRGVAARITLQRYIRLYTHVGGMTGTAWTDRREFYRLYRCRVQRVPTHRPERRSQLPTCVFATRQAKWEAVALAVDQIRSTGRAVLIGTPSIRASEELSERLQAAGIPHRVLNARQDAAEADIVSQAGQAGTVTIATNMAGRGTDIELTDVVRMAGGLHVIATEMHSSRRIDRQLIGRASRQGDPGSWQFLLSVEDELLFQIPEKQRKRWMERAQQFGRDELPVRNWLPVFRNVQRRLETAHVRDRRRLLKSEKQRWQTLRQMGLDPTLDLAEDA